jgi:zinc transport system permease protein
MIIAMLAGTPVGSTIVAADAVVFGICCIVGAVTGGIRK